MQTMQKRVSSRYMWCIAHPSLCADDAFISSCELTIHPKRHRSTSNGSGLRFSNSGKGAKLRLEAADFAAVAADYGHYEVMHGLMLKQGAGNKRSWKARYFVQVFNFLYVGTTH